MSQPTPTLTELAVHLLAPKGGRCRAHFTLSQRRPYPPLARLEAGRVQFADESERLAEASAEVAYGPLAALAAPQPPGPAGSAAARDAAWRETAAAWPVGVAADRARRAGALLFAGRGAELLARLLAALPREDSPAAPPAAVGRIVLTIEAEALQRIPWEWLPVAEGNGEPLWRRVAVVRRSPAPAGEYSGAYDVPLDVAVYTLAAAAQAPGWADGLFDERAGSARAAGAITWRETAEFPEGGEVHHLVYSSGQAPERGEGFTVRRTDGKVVAIQGPYGPSGRDRLEAALQAETRSGPRPRLLVLHDVAAALPAYLSADLVAAGLAAGADAVLAVSFAGTEAGQGGFFPAFYGRMMHNWPLDLCLHAGLTAAAPEARPTGWLLGLRRGGELRLLLTGTLVEGGALPVAPAEGRAGAEMAEETAAGAPWLADEAQRPARLVGQWRRALGRAQAEEWQAAAHDVAEIGYATTFDDSMVDLRRLVRARGAMHEATEVRASAERALRALAAVSPEAVARAAVRLTNLWLTEGGDAERRAVTAAEALTLGARYDLRLAIGPRRVEALAAEVFPEDDLREAFVRHERLPLQVALFAPSGDFDLPARQATLWLPRAGASDELALPLTPLRAGRLRLRVGLYYHNVLLQSLQWAGDVRAAAGEGEAAPAPMHCLIDYVASPDLALLEELPSPMVTLFTSRAEAGTHWVGVYAEDDRPGVALTSGAMHTFGVGDLAARAAELRGLLADIEGERTYQFAAPAYGPGAAGESRRAAREDDLVRLALAGWGLFHHLFLAAGGPEDRARRVRYREALRRPGIICVARCEQEEATLPWAALYSLPLDAEADGLALCPLFRAQLAANTWNAFGEPAVVHDLLDDPAACLAQGDCPLNGDAAEATVCPFGFWGLLHELEQPLQQVTETPADRVPVELQRPGFSQDSLLRRDGGPLRLGMGVSPMLLDADLHRAEIAALADAEHLLLTCEDDYAGVLKLLKAGERPLYYFYCHGEMHANDGGIAQFGLKLGPESRPRYLTASSLDPDAIPWADPLRPEQMQPLVFLNGCETVALTPEAIHDFMATLKAAGALGVVGTEIKVWTHLARPFARQVLGDLLAGRSMGEAFLAARRRLLRQLNPLGLAYTLNAPATLHLHPTHDCPWCRAHLPMDEAETP